MIQTSPISIGNYREIIEPTLTKREQAVLDHIKAHPDKTCKEIAAIMGVTDNVISGRYKALREKGKIVQTGSVRIGRSNHGIYRAV